MMITDAFLKEIPKTDVHLHLDGSLRLTTLIELAQKNNVALPFYDEENLRNAVFPDHYEDLPSYLRGFRYTCAVMQKAEDLTRISTSWHRIVLLKGYGILKFDLLHNFI